MLTVGPLAIESRADQIVQVLQSRQVILVAWHVVVG
jgi:hypothetical protein